MVNQWSALTLTKSFQLNAKCIWGTPDAQLFMGFFVGTVASCANIRATGKSFDCTKPLQTHLQAQWFVGAFLHHVQGNVHEWIKHWTTSSTSQACDTGLQNTRKCSMNNTLAPKCSTAQMFMKLEQKRHQEFMCILLLIAS